MSDSLEPDPAAEPHEDGLTADADEQVVDALPVLSGPPRIVDARAFRGALSSERRGVAMIPAVQAAAVAAGGFVAGAAMLGLVHRRQRQSSALSSGRRVGRELSRRGARRGRGGEDVVQILSSRSLLLDVHLLGRPGADAER
ncbi:MAG TPA: hypothetical protein VFY36_03250 [Solirubrobacteraceae bacterium]|nr:hypothetical protein [Solirubrobacteraceae bacterium]